MHSFSEFLQEVTCDLTDNIVLVTEAEREFFELSDVSDDSDNDENFNVRF